MSTHARWLALLGLLVLVALAYYPGVGGGYAFDDYSNIVDNDALKVGADWRSWIAASFSSPSSDLQRPLAMFTFAINRYFTDADPAPMKLTNIALHMLNAALVLLLARRLLFAWRERYARDTATPSIEWTAFAVAALWALAPINLMAVLFIVQRMESLSHTFVLLGLAAYLPLRERRLRTGGSLAAIGVVLVGCTVLGVLAKESAVLLPLYAALVELCVYRGVDAAGRRDRRVLALYALILVLPGLVGSAWLLPRMFAVGAYVGRHFDLTERLLTEGRVLCDYIHWSVLPDLGALSLYHDDYLVSRGFWSPPATAVALVALASLLAIAFVMRTRRPLFALGIFLFFSAHLLTATVIPLELVYEHRNYFASFGLYLALADLLVLAPWPMPRARIALFGALIVVALSVTHLRAREWSDPVRFAVSEAAKHPASPRATYALGRTYVVLGDFDPASPYTAQAYDALELARKAPGATLLPEQALLTLAARSGAAIDPDWWRSALDKLHGRAIGVQDVAAIASLVTCANRRECAFPPDDMLALIWAGMAASGESPDLLTLYANYALNSLGDSELALTLFENAVVKAPRQPTYRANLAKLLIALQRWDDAEREIEKIETLGRLGQNGLVVAELRERLRTARPH